MDVSFSCVCPVIDNEFRHNIIKVAVDPQGDSRVDPQNMHNGIQAASRKRHKVCP